MPHIVVLVKVVPNVSQLRFDPVKKTLIREGVKNIVNPHDERAIEEAVRIKEKRGGVVDVVCMGPPQVEQVLREVYALGVDGVYLLTDRAFGGADTLATSTALSLMCRKIGFDIVLGGKYSVDAETAQLIPEVSELLGTALVTNAVKIEFASDTRLVVEREIESGYESFEVSLPATLSVSEKINRPRVPRPQDRDMAKTKSVVTVAASQLSDDLSLFGSAGSPTTVTSVYDVAYTRNPVVFDASKDPERTVANAAAAIERLLQLKPAVTGVISDARGDPSKKAWATFFGDQVEADTAIEVLSRLNSLGYYAEAVFIGEHSEEELRRASRYGAKSVVSLRIKVDGWSSAAVAQGLVSLISREKPYAVFFPSTVKGREVAGRVAAALRLGLTGDAVDLIPAADGGIIQVKPAFGGNIMAEIVSRTLPQLATVRPGVFEAREAGSQSEINVKHVDLSVSAKESVSIIGSRPAEIKSDLYHSKFVICAGYGVGSPEGFREVSEFAAYVNAAVGATRKIVDLGWAPPQLQVGLTGKSINPELYLALGVSGATNHMVGVRRARVIVAVNKDPRATIFSACDVGIVADYKVAIQYLKEKLRSIGLALSKTG